MRIAIIGAGAVGGSLGRGWSRAGHTIAYGVPDPADPKHRAAATVAGGAALGTAAEALRDADAVVLAVPWSAVDAALAACGDLGGRVLIDVTNPLRAGEDGLELALGFDTSGAEEVARLAPGARVVKAMNQVGFAVMADSSGYPVRPGMFVAGDDADAKAAALALVEDLGFEALDAGPLRLARLLEPHAMLWIHQVVNRGAPADAAFALMRKDEATASG